jgi:16S rRNA (cytosine1402-N4)-methyltransferase
MHNAIHLPVLAAECLHALNIRPGGTYVDCTFGRGGHTHALLQHLDNNGRVFAFDQDPQAIAAAHALADARLYMIHANFAELGRHLEAHCSQVDGFLFDLGVSSPQLDDAERGFSFMRDGLLDMRMNPHQGISAATWLAHAKDSEIADVLYQYGDERYSRRIARAIVAARQQQPIQRTLQLAEIISAAHPAHEWGKHPATRSFQAIRIFLNRELEALEQALPQALSLLASGGRLAVISFHSLEDRIVKRFIRDQTRGGDFPPDVPVTSAAFHPRLKPIGKAIHPNATEIAHNPRARSAVLRVAQKLE